MLHYSKGQGDLENWLVSEVEFSPDTLGKAEAIFSLGNGYMGVRSAAEEFYGKETRNTFINGTFNKAQVNEVTELPNLADVTAIEIRVDGERFSLEFGKTKNYIRQLNLKTAELTRSFDWVSPKGKELRFQFRRFVSLDNKHLLGMKMDIACLKGPVHISFDSGINAQMTNTGSQHLLEGERRVFGKQFIQLVQTTSESNVDIVATAGHIVRVNGEKAAINPDMDMARRKVWLSYAVTLQSSDTLELEKLTTFHTSRDQKTAQANFSLQQLREQSLKEAEHNVHLGYRALFQRHRQTWQEKVWSRQDVQIDSADCFDQLALRFSLYHLTAMTPVHDERMGIPAKGLSGEGYKGHSFWDTEIFILPYFIFAKPEAARSLLLYRYHGLEGARRKAAENGYEGAMYPWEMAWPTDGEVTPEWGDIDIVTGAQSKILSGAIEQHISADIAFAVYQYFSVTGDEKFMDDYGYEMIFETASFWASRLEWNAEHGRYHITGVIGPDEYKEHVSNNAFTNYMAYFNMQLAMRYYKKLKQENRVLLEDFAAAYKVWQEKSEALYLPDPRASDAVIPQDDTYLGLKEIDLTKYKNQDRVRTIYRDYNAEQINEIQVSKQTDTLLLFYLLNQTFLRDDPRLAKGVMEANFRYYEPRTLHDSSLSLAAHAILAADIGDVNLAYSLFKKAAEVDIGPKMNTSDDGIHAAAIGGIWKAGVFGFAGVRVRDGKLRIDPRLPDPWRSMKFSLCWRGQEIDITVTKERLTVSANSKKKLEFETAGTFYESEDRIEVPLSAGRSTCVTLQGLSEK